MSQNRQYELVYIVSPDASEQAVADLHTQVEQIVQRFNGTLDKTENWGRRKLAYEIGHAREGTYVVETITGTGELMKEIDRRLRVTDTIIRHLTVRVDEDLKRGRAPAQRAQGDPGPPPHGARPAAGAAGVRAPRRPGRRRSGRRCDGP